MKTSQDSLYQYEGGIAHTLDKVHYEGGQRRGALVCSRCDAHICDHNPLTAEDGHIGNLRWTVVTTVYMPAREGFAGGVQARPEIVDDCDQKYTLIPSEG